MVVDANHDFLTQRELPRLALIKPTYSNSVLTLTAPGMSPLSLEPTGDQRYPVSIWRDIVVAADQGEHVADWLSSYLHARCRLVRIPDDVVRPVDSDYATRLTDQVGFSDGYPPPLISEESLASPNHRLPVPLPMNRFRPNVVVSGTGLPHAEDTWSQIQIADVAFRLVKACARCVTTCTDQSTAERGLEP